MLFLKWKLCVTTGGNQFGKNFFLHYCSLQSVIISLKIEQTSRAADGERHPTARYVPSSSTGNTLNNFIQYSYETLDCFCFVRVAKWMG